MQEFDSHTEHAHDQAHEAAHESKEKWITGVALTAAILAALAALTSMLSGHHEHESMMEQMKATDVWSRYQAKKIKSEIRSERKENLELAGEKVPQSLLKQLDESKGEQQKIAAEARELEGSASVHDKLHMVFAGGVTLFQVAIAVSAISALTRQKPYWFVGMSLGALAAGFMVAGLLGWSGAIHMRPHEEKTESSLMLAPSRTVL